MPPTTTDAQDRAERFLGAHTREDLQQLPRIDAGRAPEMVLDGAKHPVPYEPGKVALSLEFGAATPFDSWVKPFAQSNACLARSGYIVR